VDINYLNKSLIFLVAMSMIALMCQHKRTRLILVVAIFLSAVFFSINNTAGRRDIISVLICGFVIFQYLGWKSSFKNIVLMFGIGIFSFLSAFIVTITRSFDMTESMWHYSKRIYVHYDGISGAMLGLADFGVAYDNYLHIINNIAEIGYLWGISFVRIFLAFIPREIWQDKPVDVQALIVEKGIISTYAGGTSQSMTFIGEMYWNMGVVSVIIGMMGMGILFRLMDKKLLSNQPGWIMLSLSMLPFSFLLWRGAFNTQFIYIFITAMFLFFVYKFTVIIHFLFRKSVRS
jgi:hypothetical protein